VNKSENPYESVAAAMDSVYALARDYVLSLPNRPAGSAATRAELTATLDEPLPEHQSDPAGVAAEWLKRAQSGIVGSPGPRFFGFVLGGVTPGALAGDWLASTIDQNGGLWAISPAATQTEIVVLRWLKELFGLPAGWTGSLTSGATQSNTAALAAARQWAGAKLGHDIAADGMLGCPPFTVVSSEAIHASARKGLANNGLGRNAVRTVPAPGGQVDVAALNALLAGIDGPVIVVANAGEVNTGQFDDLNAIADLVEAHPGGGWLHVDGAFGLFAGASPKLKHLIAGIERADSVASDGHKWLNVPYDCGFVFFKDAENARATFTTLAAYLAGDGGWDADDYGLDMSRRFRALPAWCALKAYGRDGYREMVERCVANTRAFIEWIDATPGLELMNAERLRESALNIVCFRVACAGKSDAEADEVNRAAAAAIQADGRAFVSGTVWNGRRAMRAAFDNWATTLDDIRILQEAVLAASRC
jgi:glutamate/tyrosine decarboxylase-like PLP-dependent enzyme